jgi:hypothetical protein
LAIHLYPRHKPTPPSTQPVSWKSMSARIPKPERFLSLKNIAAGGIFARSNLRLR